MGPLIGHFSVEVGPLNRVISRAASPISMTVSAA